MKLAGNTKYSPDQMVTVREAFGPLINEDGSPATDAQLSEWVDASVQEVLKRFFGAQEAKKANVAIQKSLAEFKNG